ncbi:MAG: SRPBCC domain-containing protein [Polyangiales bacterium]
MKPQIELSALIAATPQDVYDAWLDSERHSKMTGGGPASVQPIVGSAFTAWDGYIRGVNEGLESGRRIVQAWRTTEFPADAPDSRVDILLEAEGAGTRVSLRHDAIPIDQVEAYRGGWEEFYFAPMRRYFADLGTSKAAAPSTPRR